MSRWWLHNLGEKIVLTFRIGVSINELSRLLEHSSVSSTLNKYASAIDSRDTQVALKLMKFNYNDCHYSVTQDHEKEILDFNKEA